LEQFSLLLVLCLILVGKSNGNIVAQAIKTVINVLKHYGIQASADRLAKMGVRIPLALEKKNNE